MMPYNEMGMSNAPPTQDCVVYARYSSHAQRDVSIEQQVADCEAYARSNGLRVVKVYADRAISGTNDKRPQFQKMLKDAERAGGLMCLPGRWTVLPVTAMIRPPINTGSSVTGSG